jgi:hypothetical protein
MTQSFEVQPKKKPYQSPKLLIYGSLAQMTQQGGVSGKPDGGKKFRSTRTGG